MFVVAVHVDEEDPLLLFGELRNQSFAYRSKAGAGILVRVL